MGRPADYKAGAGGGERRRKRPGYAPPYRRPSGVNEDGAPTVRNLLPWRNTEKELAKRLAAKAARGELSDDRFVSQADFAPPRWKGNAEPEEPAPDSGVRSSMNALPSVDDDPARPLTYSMYTISELEDVRRSRLSMAPYAEPQPSGFRDVGRSALAVLRAFGSWVRAAKPRPRLMDVCRVPLVAFGADLRAALGKLPWKKVAWAAAFTVGALALFLFAVMTVAELTDDVKPKRSTSRSTIDTSLVGQSADTAAQPTAALPAVKSAEQAPAAKKVETAPAQIEIDEEAPPPATANNRASAPKTKPSKIPREAELFIP